MSKSKRALNLNSTFSNSLLRFRSTLVLVRNCFLKVQETEFSESFKKTKEEMSEFIGAQPTEVKREPIELAKHLLRLTKSISRCSPWRTSE